MGSQVVKIFPPKDDEVRSFNSVHIVYKCILVLTLLAFPPLLSEQHAGVALSALIRGLDELKMVAIVRYAYDRRSNPQVGAAFPCIKQNYEVRPQA